MRKIHLDITGTMEKISIREHLYLLILLVNHSDHMANGEQSKACRSFGPSGFKLETESNTQDAKIPRRWSIYRNCFPSSS